MKIATKRKAAGRTFLANPAKFQAAALLFRPNPTATSGIDRIEASVNELFRMPPTAESVRKHWETVCCMLNCGTEETDKLTMIQAIEYLETEGRRPTIAPLSIFSRSVIKNSYI